MLPNVKLLEHYSFFRNLDDHLVSRQLLDLLANLKIPTYESENDSFADSFSWDTKVRNNINDKTDLEQREGKKIKVVSLSES